MKMNDKIAVICSNCKWGKYLKNDESSCYWAYKNLKKMPQLPFYAYITDSDVVYRGSTTHWFPRFVKEDDAKRCKLFETEE